MTKELFIKFIPVGILNTIFGYGVYVLLLFLGAQYSLAALARLQLNYYAAGAALLLPMAVVAFLPNRNFVFNKAAQGPGI